MDVLARAVSAIDWINRCVGRVVAWLTLATVLICGAVVLLRYSAGIGLVWLQELYVWTHAMTFLLAAGFAYLLNAHVRVDIFYARLSARAIQEDGARLVGWIANEVDPAMARRDENFALLSARMPVPCWGRLPHVADIDAGQLSRHIAIPL